MPDLQLIFPHLPTQTITDLYKIVPEDFIGTCTKSSQDLGQHFHIPLGPLKVQHINLARLWCKRLRSRNAHGRITRTGLRENLLEKAAPHPFCVVLRNRHAHGISWTRPKSSFYNAAGRDNRFAWTCAVETRMLQKPPKRRQPFCACLIVFA